MNERRYFDGERSDFVILRLPEPRMTDSRAKAR